jgi:hypothetical protein
MRARIREPGESLRWLFYGLAAICISAAAIFRIQIGPPLDPVFFIGAALLFMSPIFKQRTRWRPVTIEARPGHLRISGRGIFGNRDFIIAVKNLIGGSSARFDGNPHLVLSVGSKSRHPVIIAFENEPDAQLAASSLGIGKKGFGVLIWERAPRPAHVLAAGTRVIGALACLIISVVAKFSDVFAATLDTQSVSTLAVVGALAFVMAIPFVIARRSLALESNGVRIFEVHTRFLPYATIASIELKTSCFEIDRAVRKNAPRGELEAIEVPFVKRTAFLPGLDDVDTSIIASQIQASAENARLSTGPEYLQQVSTLLAKKDRETNDAWIRRIDDLAESWRASPPRYGESITTTHALWQAVEDHDCDETLRVLAARMLSKLDPEAAPPKLRVIAEAIRIPRQASQIRIALEPEVEPMAKSIPKSTR